MFVIPATPLLSVSRTGSSARVRSGGEAPERRPSLSLTGVLLPLHRNPATATRRSPRCVVPAPWFANRGTFRVQRVELLVRRTSTAHSVESRGFPGAKLERVGQLR